MPHGDNRPGTPGFAAVQLLSFTELSSNIWAFTVCPMTAVSELQDADAATCVTYNKTYPAQVEPLVNVTMVTQCQHDKQMVI